MKLCPTFQLLVVLCSVIALTFRSTNAQFGDGAAKLLDPGELLNQLLIRSKTKNIARQQQEQQQSGLNNNGITIIEATQRSTPATPFPSPPSRPSLGIRNSIKKPPRLPPFRRPENKPPINKACHGRNCEDSTSSASSVADRWSMPLIYLGNKQYYLGIFFKANWYKAAQYCRFHGMNLAAIESERENRVLESHIQDAGLGHEHFWTSGTDQGEEGRFFWMASGKPVTFENWNAGEPNNFQYEDGEMEHCLELWNRDGKGLKWNDSPCSFETFFLCEVS